MQTRYGLNYILHYRIHFLMTLLSTCSFVIDSEEDRANKAFMGCLV